MAQTTIAPLPPMPKRGGRAAAPRKCECGCTGMTRGGRYIPGHDSRQRGWAIRITAGADTTGITPGERASAERWAKAHAAEMAKYAPPAQTDERKTG